MLWCIQALFIIVYFSYDSTYRLWDTNITESENISDLNRTIRSTNHQILRFIPQNIIYFHQPLCYDIALYVWKENTNINVQTLYNSKSLMLTVSELQKIFLQHNIYLRIKYFETWNGQGIEERGDSVDFDHELQRIEDYAVRHQHIADTYVLLKISTSNDERIPSGKAKKNSVCTSNAVVFVQVHEKDNEWSHIPVGIKIAQQLGHVLGFENTDDSNCECGTNPKSCIMQTQQVETKSELVRPFEKCRIEELSRNIWRYDCLTECSKAVSGYRVTFCGNGILEKDEDCDCGSPEICRRNDPNNCCNPLTCRFREPQYECSNGDCCSKCYFKISQTLNIKKQECQEKPTCLGDSPFSKIISSGNGEKCSNDMGTCVAGKCVIPYDECRKRNKLGDTYHKSCENGIMDFLKKECQKYPEVNHDLSTLCQTKSPNRCDYMICETSDVSNRDGLYFSTPYSDKYCLVNQVPKIKGMKQGAADGTNCGDLKSMKCLDNICVNFDNYDFSLREQDNPFIFYEEKSGKFTISVNQELNTTSGRSENIRKRLVTEPPSGNPDSMTTAKDSEVKKPIIKIPSVDAPTPPLQPNSQSPIIEDGLNTTEIISSVDSASDINQSPDHKPDVKISESIEKTSGTKSASNQESSLPSEKNDEEELDDSNDNLVSDSEEEQQHDAALQPDMPNNQKRAGEISHLSSNPYALYSGRLGISLSVTVILGTSISIICALNII